MTGIPAVTGTPVDLTGTATGKIYTGVFMAGTKKNTTITTSGADASSAHHETAHTTEVDVAHIHTHTAEDGTVYTHSHTTEDGTVHTHHHHHENTKAVLNRMNRAIGHMEAIKTMIENDRDCSEVLIQIAAVRSAINNIGKIILEDHINHCVVDAIETGDSQVLKDLNEAINKFVK